MKIFHKWISVTFKHSTKFPKNLWEYNHLNMCVFHHCCCSSLMTYNVEGNGNLISKPIESVKVIKKVSPSLNTFLWKSSITVVVQLLSHVQLFYNPTGCSPPGSSVHGILQAKALEWVAISFSRGSSWPRNGTHIFYTGKWIFYHWATRKAPSITLGYI